MYPHSALTFVGSEPDSTRVQCIHAIGDKTNGVVLDALEAALENTDVPTIRPRVEHAQLMDPKDIARLGKSGGMSDCSVVGKQRLTVGTQ